ncbi:MAG: phage tail protein [Vicinamibacterales bacterium]
MPASSRRDPFHGFNFRVEIDGVAVAAFAQVSGLSSETDVVEYREGADFRARKLPGLTKYANIVLKRGITVDRSLWEWRKAITNGRIDRRNGAIILMDAERNEVARWTFVEGWPAKWEGPDLDARSNDVAIETLEIAHEGLEWEG